MKNLLGDFSKGSVEEKNAQDTDGKTAFHVLIESGKIHTTFGESVLRLLLNHNCNGDIPDKQGRRPIDLLRPTDTAYTILKKSIKTGNTLKYLNIGTSRSAFLAPLSQGLQRSL